VRERGEISLFPILFCPMNDVLRLARERARAERSRDADAHTHNDTLRAAEEALAGLPTAPAAEGSDGHARSRAPAEPVAGLPAGARFEPAFLTPSQQAAVLAAVDAASVGRWIAGGTADSPRLIANFGGSPGRAAVTEALPRFLQTLAAGLAARLGWAAPPAHCLVNDYRGTSGLVHHTDGPLYSCSAVITLGGPALLELRPAAATGGGRGAPPPAHLLLRPGCALGLAGPAYSDWTHGIAAAAADTIPPSCVNVGAGQVGQVVARAPRRVSLVFVCKVRESGGRQSGISEHLHTQR
jgi:hypothetical protein